MGDCYKLSALQHWLNGMTGQNESEQIAEHIKSCIACQQRLADLTDDDWISPPADPSSLDGGSRFTSEPHFTSLKKRLSEQVKKMVREQKDDPFVDPENDELKNELATELQPVQDRDTVSAHDDPTVDTDADENPELDSMEPGFPDIEGFRIEKLIGKGGFAHVYQAWDSRLSRTVAVKVLDQHRIDPRNRHRFSREAKTASSIDSPSVVKVLSSGETASGQPFIVMELVGEGSLADWIARQQDQNQLDRQAIKQGVELIVQACRGAEAVHQAGLVHRDIKPGNIFVEQNGSKLGDFGLARLMDGDTVTLTRAAETTGTPAYMSPEQIDSAADVDNRSDVYSLGATLYHLLAGQAPFRGSSIAILKQVTEAEPLSPQVLNENVDRNLETICLKALNKTPGRRYANAKTMADDLERSLQGHPILARPVSRLETSVRWARNNATLAATLTLFVLSMIAGTVVSTTFWLRSEKNAAVAQQRAEKLEENRKTLTATQSQLIDSINNLVTNSFSRISLYLQMSASDRQAANQTMMDAHESIFAAASDDPELIRQLANGLATATEINLELQSQYWQTLEMARTNKKFVDQLMDFPEPTERDRSLAAWVYNQLGACLQSLAGKTANIKAGAAGWKTKTETNEETAAAFQEAFSLSTPGPDSPPELILEHFKARLALDVHSEAGQDSTEDVTNRMLDLLTEVETIRIDEWNSREWFSFHHRLLLGLSKRSKGQASIDYRIQRKEVMYKFVERLGESGQETFWFDRKVAVNDFFIGIALLNTGNVTEGTASVDLAVQRFQGLVEAFPQNVQYRADLAEAQMILGDIAWNGGDQDLALESYEAALVQFEANLKIDWQQIGFRRRVSHVYEKVGKRYEGYEAADKSELAMERFSAAIRHIKVILKSGAEPAFESTDRQFLTRLESYSTDRESDSLN